MKKVGGQVQAKVLNSQVVKEKEEVQGISHLKQLSKLGVHLRQLSYGQQNNVKITNDIKNCEQLALNMDLELHEKKIGGE